MHRLVGGRTLRLGCVTVPADFGPLGHSDGDAAAHAVCDALLGAAALGDMGRWFPSSDERWRDANSESFLVETAALLAREGWEVSNLDVTIVLENPRLGVHLPKMRESIAAALGCRVEQVSVKAKSADGLGPIGAGEAVEARAVALIESTPPGN
ncbi:MAG: 2-C-methyl-D-erythritol 2,4-cyclodiphosphate synthase [Hyphomicrobiaceae bacterium]|jgi:2-C-methyl-D-erythritol 2,4-cyclodiphosphate synthase